MSKTRDRIFDMIAVGDPFGVGAAIAGEIDAKDKRIAELEPRAKAWDAHWEYESKGHAWDLGAGATEDMNDAMRRRNETRNNAYAAQNRRVAELEKEQLFARERLAELEGLLRESGTMINKAVVSVNALTTAGDMLAARLDQALAEVERLTAEAAHWRSASGVTDGPAPKGVAQL